MIAVVGGAGIVITMKAKPPAQDGMPVPEREDDIIAGVYGCAFNIALKLAGMGCDVAFAGLVGNDMPGLAALEQLRSAGIDTRHVKAVQGASPIKAEIINVLGDPEFLRTNDTMYAKLTPEAASEWDGLLKEADAIVMDGVLPQETLEYIASTYGDHTRIFFDPAGPAGGEKVIGILDKLYCVMPGRTEAEFMTQKTILSEEQLKEAGRYFDEKGVAKTIITMKGGGLYYKEGEQEGVVRPERILSFARTAGAGDVVSAAVIAGSMKGEAVAEIAARAMRDAAEFLSGLKDEKSM